MFTRSDISQVWHIKVRSVRPTNEFQISGWVLTGTIHAPLVPGVVLLSAAGTAQRCGAAWRHAGLTTSRSTTWGYPEGYSDTSSYSIDVAIPQGSVPTPQQARGHASQ